MKQSIISCITLFLSACSTTIPTTPRFPSAPVELLEKCPSLKTMDPKDPSIVLMSKTIVQNYTEYYQCSNKVDSWIEWYNEQKKNSKSIK